MMDVGKIT